MLTHTLVSRVLEPMGSFRFSGSIFGKATHNHAVPLQNVSIQRPGQAYLLLNNLPAIRIVHAEDIYKSLTLVRLDLLVLAQ